MQELDAVALTVDLPEHGLERGDLGAIVHVYPGEEAFEVEFVTLGGETVALVTLPPDQIRLTGSREIAHVRSIGLT